MAKTRKNIYFTENQVRRLEQKSKEENLSEAEIVRRALDAYLAWDDPTYQPGLPMPQARNAHSSWAAYSVSVSDRNLPDACGGSPGHRASEEEEWKARFAPPDHFGQDR